MSQTVRDRVHALLREREMTTVFGNPGSTELPMFRDFPADFRYVLGLQESVCLGMADGYAQATGRAALVNLHSAAGVGHAMGNLFTAWRNRTPLVVTAGQQARSMLGSDPFLVNDRATELPRPYGKWACEPPRPQDVPAALARAWHIAMTPPCGPVFVSIPVDDWDEPCEPPLEPGVQAVIAGRSPSAQVVAELAERLDGAARPVVVAGAEVDRDHATAELVRLVERHGASVWTAPMSSRNAFPEDHPGFAGFLPASREGIRERLAGHDLVLVIGAPAFTQHVEGHVAYLDEGAHLVQVTESPDTASWAPAGTSIVAGVRDTLTLLLDRSEPGERPRPQGRPAPARLPEDGPLTEALVMQLLADLRPESSIVVEEAPGSRPVMQERLPFTRPESFFTCASGGLGHGLPAAVGVALARPEQQVIGLIGDGSSMYAIQALWTAAQEQAAVTFVVVDNGGYAALDDFATHFDIAKPVGTRLSGIDYAGLARSLGCQGVSVRTAQELAEALPRAFGQPGPVLIDVHVD